MKKIPLHSLVLMIGPSGAGKTTLAKKHFNEFEIISAESIKHNLVGDATRQDVNKEIYNELHHRVRLKLKLGERVVVDSSNLKDRDRKKIANLGDKAGVEIFYIVYNRPLVDKEATGGWRNDAGDLLKRQDDLFNKYETEILSGDSIAEVVDARVDEFEAVQKLPKGDLFTEIKKRKFKGITAIADIHAMRHSLKSAINWATSRNHFMIFLGDIIDYGPKPIECFDDIYDIVMNGNGAIVYGNHERKIDRWIDQDRRGNVNLRLSNGNKVTINAIEKLTTFQRQQFESKFKGLMKVARNHFIVDNILFTHGAGHPDMWEKEEIRLKDRRLSSLALFGDIDDDLPPREDGYPNRIYTWCDDIPEGKICLVGHDIRSTGAPLVVNNDIGGQTVFLDTGSGKSGGLTSADIRFKTLPLKIETFNRH